MFYHLLFPLHELFSGFNVFRYITFRSIGGAITAFFIVLVLDAWFIGKMQQLQVGQVIRTDGPRSHLSKKGVPTMGGMLIVFALLSATFLWARIDNGYVWLIMAATLFFGAIGALDDYRKISRQHSGGLSARAKLALQCVGALAVGMYMYVQPGFDGALSVPFLKNVRPDLGLLYIVFAMVVIVGASNAVNLTDGLDGLATGPTVVSAAVYVIFSYIAGNIVIAQYLQVPYVVDSGELSVFCAAMVGACLGFLWFNAYPAQVFMGDVGSLAIGGGLGTVAIIIKQEMLLAIVGGIFVAEAVSVMLQVGYFKLSKGKRIFLMAPFHHHFEKQGMHETKVVVRFWIVAIILGFVAMATLKLR